MGHVLVTTALERTYEADGVAVAALRGIDLAVAEGEFVSVMGPRAAASRPSCTCSAASTASSTARRTSSVAICAR